MTQQSSRYLLIIGGIARVEFGQADFIRDVEEIRGKHLE